MSASEWWFFSIYGPPAFVMSFLWNVLLFSLGIGLWRLRNFVRKVTIGLIIFSLVSTTPFRLSPTYQEALVERLGWDEPSLMIGLTIFQTVVQALISGLVIWFLIKRKAAFVKPQLSTVPAQPA